MLFFCCGFLINYESMIRVLMFFFSFFFGLIIGAHCACLNSDCVVISNLCLRDGKFISVR
jgi:hypothetical protein